MATAGVALGMPAKMDDYLRLMEKSAEASGAIEAVRLYLASWSKERIAIVQKIDAGWAPFDTVQRPLQVNGALDVRCIRDAIHCHCMTLRHTSLALTPELMELDEFFFAANAIIETNWRVQTQSRAPAVPSHRDLIANW
jgi:hypothetical protein